MAYNVIRKQGEKTKAPVQKAGGNEKVLALLQQIGERLISSEKERIQVQETLDEYREMFADLEDKAMLTEKAYITVQNQITKREALEQKILARQEALQKGLEEKMEKIERAAALADRFDELLARQERLARRLEKMGKERLLLTKKLDRIEESVTETQDVIHDNARWMLAGKKPANESVRDEEGAPAMPMSLRQDRAEKNNEDLPWWGAASFQLQAAAMVVIILFAGALGWGMTALYNKGALSVEPLKTQWAALMGSLAEESYKDHATYNNDTAVADAGPLDSELKAPIDITSGRMAGVKPAVGSDLSGEADKASDALEMSDEARLAAFEENPAALAEKLNAIAPESLPDDQVFAPGDAAESAPLLQAIPDSVFAGVPLFLASQQSKKPLDERLNRDEALPDIVRPVEDKAFEGVAAAQHDLGAIYTAGHAEVPVDYMKAAAWFREAGLQGVANARYNLGVLYHQGLGVPQDVNTAMNWYRAAAYLGHPEAQYNLGIAYIEGIGADYDPALAALFFERAAQGGIMEAAYNLGLIFENGLLGEPNQKEALRWYQKAADEGSAEAQKALEQLSAVTGALNTTASTATAAHIQASPLTENDALPNGDNVAQGRPADIQASRAIIAQVQEQLVRQGLYPGPADGLLGPVTVDAIRSYQKRYQLAQTGEASQALLVHMLTSGLDVADGDVGSREE